MLIKKQCSYGLKSIFIRTLSTIIISILFTNQVKADFESFTLTQIDSIQLELETASSVDKRLSLLMEAAQILYNQRLYEKSMEFAEEAYNTSKENNYEKSQAQAMLQMARIHRKLNNTNKAFEVAIETKKLADDKGFTLESAEASIILSATLFITGEFEKSAELAFNSLEVLEQNKKFSDLCYAKSLIGLVYNVNDNDSLAVDYLTNAINLGKEHKCYTELGVAIANLAVIYGKKEDYQKAYSFQKQACNILAEHVPNSPAEGMGYCNLAVYLFKSNQPDSAFKYITKALTHSIRINNSRNIAIAHKGIAYYYQHNNDEPNFLKHINLAYKITEQNDYKIPQMEVARTLEEFYVEKGRMDSAYKYQGISAAIEKEFNSQNTLTKLMQLQMMKEFEIAEKAQRIKDQRHKFIAIMSLFAFVSALVILFVLFMRYKLKMRYLNLKQEKLKNELHFKSKEMVDSTMTLIRKNEIISSITERLLTIINKNGKNITSELSSLLNDLQHSNEGNVWKEFDVRFKQIHSRFYDNLIAANPDMSPNDLKICAFLRLNMTTKEISDLTGLQPRSIENARTRIRKKLGLNSTKENLVTYLSRF